MFTPGMPAAAISNPASGSNISAPAPMMPAVTWIASYVATRFAIDVYTPHSTADANISTLPSKLPLPDCTSAPEKTIRIPTIDRTMPDQRSADACSRSHTTATSAVIAGMQLCTSAPCEADVYTSE